VTLTNTFDGDMSSKLIARSDGKGMRVGIKENTLCLLRPGESSNDFCAMFNPVVWFNQTRSREMVSNNGKPPLTKITQNMLHGGEESILEKQIEDAKASKFDHFEGFGFPKPYVFDVFSNRLKGVRLDVSKLPNNLLLTTEDNFGTGVGPVYKRTLEVALCRIKIGLLNSKRRRGETKGFLRNLANNSLLLSR